MTVIGSVEFEASLNLDKFNQDINKLIAKNKSLIVPINVQLDIDQKSIVSARKQFEEQLKKDASFCVPLRFCDDSIAKAKRQLRKEFKDFCIPLQFCGDELEKTQKQLSSLTKKYSVSSTLNVIHQNKVSGDKEKSGNSQQNKLYQQNQRLSSSPKSITEDSLKRVLEKTTLSTKTSFSEKLFSGTVASFVAPVIQKAGQGLGQQLEKSLGQYIGDFETFFPIFFAALGKTGKLGIESGVDILQGIWKDQAPAAVQNILESITKSFTEKRSTGTPIDSIIKGLKMDIEKYIEDIKENFLPDESTRKTVAASAQQKVSYTQKRKKESGALFLLQEIEIIDRERKNYIKKYEEEIKTLRFFLKMAAKLEKASPEELKKLEAELNSLPEMQGNEDFAKTLSAFAKDKDAQTEKAIQYLADLEKSIQDLDERFYGVVDALADAPVPEKIKPTVEKIRSSKDEIQSTQSVKSDSLQGVFQKQTKTESLNVALASYSASLDESFLNDDIEMIFQEDQGIKDALEQIAASVTSALASVNDVIQEFSIPDTENIKQAILKTNVDIRTSLSNAHVEVLEFQKKILAEQLSALAYLAKPIREASNKEELKKLRSQARQNNPVWFNQSVAVISKQTTGVSVEPSKTPILKQYDSVEGGVSYLPQTGDIAIQKNLMDALQNPTSENFDDIGKIVSAINLAIIEAVQHNFGEIKTSGDAISTLSLTNQDVNIDELLQETVFDITSGVEKTVAEVIESTVSKYPNEAKDTARELAIQKFGAAKKIEGVGQGSATTKGIFLAKAQSSIGTGGIKIIQDKIQQTVQKRQKLIELMAKSYGVDSDVMSKMSIQIDQYTNNIVQTYQVLAEQLAGFLPRLNNLTEQEIKDLMPHIKDINTLVGRNEEIFNLYVGKLEQEYAKKQERAQLATPEAFNDALAKDDITNIAGLAKKWGREDFSYDDYYPHIKKYKAQVEDIKNSPADEVDKKVKKLAKAVGDPKASFEELEAMIESVSNAASRFQGVDLKGTYKLTDEEIAVLLLYTSVGQFDNVINSYLREGIDGVTVQTDIAKAEKNHSKSLGVRQKEGEELNTYFDVTEKVQPRFTTQEYNEDREGLEKRINVYIGMLEKAMKKMGKVQSDDPLYRGIGGFVESFSYAPKSEKKETFDAFTSTGVGGYSFPGPVQFVIKPSAGKTADITGFAQSILPRTLPDNSAAREALTTPETKYRIVGEIPVNRDDVELSVPTDIQDFDYFDKALSNLKKKEYRDETFKSALTGEQMDGTIYLLEEIDPINELVSAVDPIVKRYESEAQQMAVKHGKIIETVVEQIEQISSYAEKIDLPVIPQLPNSELIEQPPIPLQLNSGLKSSNATTEYLFKDIAKIFKKSALAQFAGITESVKGVDINRIIEEAISKLGDVDPSLIMKELSEKIGSGGILSGVSEYRKSSLDKPLMDDAEIEYIKLYISDATKEFNQKIKEIKNEIDLFSQSPDLNLEDLSVKLTLVDMAMEDLGGQIEGYADYLDNIAKEKYIPIEEINGLKARINNLKNSRKQIEASRQKLSSEQDKLYASPPDKSAEIPMPDLSKIRLPEKMLVPSQNQMFGLGAGAALFGSQGGAMAAGLGAMAPIAIPVALTLAAGAGAIATVRSKALQSFLEKNAAPLAKILYVNIGDSVKSFAEKTKGVLGGFFQSIQLNSPAKKIKTPDTFGTFLDNLPDIDNSIKKANEAIVGVDKEIKSLDDLLKLRESFSILGVNIENMINGLNVENIAKNQEINFAKQNLDFSLGSKIGAGEATEEEKAIYKAALDQIEDAKNKVQDVQTLIDRLSQIKESTANVLSGDMVSDDDRQMLQSLGNEIEDIYKKLGVSIPKNQFLEEIKETGEKGTDIFQQLGKSIGGMIRGFVYFQVFGFLQNQLQNIASQTFEVTKRFTVLENTINFLSGGTKAGAEQMRFLRSEINRTSSAIEPALQSYKKLAASTRNTSMEGKVTNDITSALMQAGTVFGLTGEELEGSILAISQIAGKGTVSMEELRGQLAERIPGAFQIAARSMNVTEQELFKLISTGQLAASDFLPKFASQLSSETASGVAGASQTAQAALTRLNNSITDMQVAAGKEFQGGLVLGMNALNSVLKIVAQNAGAFIIVMQIAAGTALTYVAPAMWALVKSLWQIPLASVAANMAVNGLKDTIMTLLIPSIMRFAATTALIWVAIEAFKSLYEIWDLFTSKTQNKTWSESLSANLQKAKKETKQLSEEIAKFNKINTPRKPNEKPETEFSLLDKEQKDKLKSMGFKERLFYAFSKESMEDQVKIRESMKQTIRDSRELKDLKKDWETGSVKKLYSFIDPAMTEKNVQLIKNYNAQIELLRQKASLAQDPESQKGIKTQIEQIRKLRDLAGQPLSVGLESVSIQIQNYQKQANETNDDKLREQLQENIKVLEETKNKLLDIERQTGAQTTLSELMQVLARIRVEMEMFNRVAQEVADKALTRIAETELKGFQADVFASASASLKRSENALDLVTNKINVSKNTVKELKQLLKDPMMTKYTNYYGGKQLEELRVELEGVDEADTQRRKALEALILLREQESSLIGLQREEAEATLALEKEKSQTLLSRFDYYKAEAQGKVQVRESQNLLGVVKGQLSGQIEPYEVDTAKGKISLDTAKQNEQIAKISLETLQGYYRKGLISAEEFATRRRDLELQSVQAVQQVAEQELQLRQAVQQEIIAQIERRVAITKAFQQQGENSSIEGIRKQQLARIITEQQAESQISDIKKKSLIQDLNTTKAQLQDLRSAYVQRKIEETEFRQRERDLMTQSSDLSRQLVEQDLAIQTQKQQAILDLLDRENQKIEHQLKLRESLAQINQKSSQIGREALGTNQELSILSGLRGVDNRTRSGEDTQTRITRQREDLKLQVTRQTEDETLSIQQETSSLYAQELDYRLSELQYYYQQGEITQREFEDRSRQIEQESMSTRVQLKDYDLQSTQRINQRSVEDFERTNQRIIEDREKLYRRLVDDFERSIKRQETALQLSVIRQEQIVRQKQLRQIDLIGSQRAEQQAAITLTQMQGEQAKKQLKETLTQIKQVAKLRQQNALTEREAEERTADLTTKAEQLKLDLINKQIEKIRQVKDLKILAPDDELAKVDIWFQKQDMGLSYGLEKRKQIVDSLEKEKSIMEAQNRLQQSLNKGEEQRRQASLDRSRNAEDLLGRLPDLQKRAADNSINFNEYKGTRYLMDMVRQMAGAGSGSTFLSEPDIRDLRTKQFNQSAIEEKNLLEMKTRQLEQQQRIQLAQTELQKRLNRLTAENAVMEANISLNKARQSELQAKIALEKAKVNGDPREIQNAQMAYELARQGTQLSSEQIRIVSEKLALADQMSGLEGQAISSEQANERFALQEANRKALQDTALRGGELASQGAIDPDRIVRVDFANPITFDLSPVAPVVDLTSQISTKLDSLLSALNGAFNAPTQNIENLTVVSSDPTGDSRQVLNELTKAKNMYY